jgi:hypothetical protein
MILEASQESSVLDAMMNLGKITCDKESFNNGIRCLREALRRNEYDNGNVSQAVQPRKKKRLNRSRD